MKKSKAHDKQIKSKIKADVKKHKSLIKKSRFQNFIWKIFVPFIILIIAACVGYKGYMETRVNTPFSNNKLVDLSRLNKNDYYWGSYRPGVYFGIKSREPFSPLTGLMWYFSNMLQTDGSGLRHWCSQNDKLERYSWVKHDGKNFGIQEIVDNGVLLRTSFVKNIHSLNETQWTAKINITYKQQNLKNKKISLLYYVAIDKNTNGYINPIIDDLSNSLIGIDGETKELGYFNFNFNTKYDSAINQSYLIASTPNLNLLKETVLQYLKIISYKGKRELQIVFPSEKFKDQILKHNILVMQITGKLPIELEVRFEQNSIINQKKKLSGENYNNVLSNYEKLFDSKFENIFKLSAKGFKEEEINFAKIAFSNMIGSIGYFYGSSQVQSIYTQIPVPYWKAPLYSAVPSRSFFPRGFLWDEGFHGLILSSWDLDIEIDIISHWFDLMNIEGWIPREMILGEEALAKVPKEFVTQINTNANPPTFYITLQFILEHKQSELLSNHINFLNELYPRLQRWFEWFNITQKGEIPSTYRWQGRNEEINNELNPKTLTSGLDDYPRASHPNKNERHIDLRCWMALASKVMASIAKILNKSFHKYESTFKYLSDNKLLNKLHWSKKTNTYADYGLHTDQVKLETISKVSREVEITTRKLRVVLNEPENNFVDSSFGYVSLFPLILRLIDPSSFQMKQILQNLQKPELLWTDYGLRSLAKVSPMYMKYNTEHDPPYWRGSIWINLNYMIVSALHYYSKVDGLYKVEAEKIYVKLRNNLIRNVIDQYNKSGYIWENYNDNSGKGQGSHPFTGWSSLCILLMAELY